MNIGGIQKLTLLDYPGKVAATVFTNGCNFKCPFCHNSKLVLKEEDHITDVEVLDFLKKRKGILDGVCITGGEPLLQADIFDFIRKIKDMGYLVKLDTNGSFPDRLKDILSSGFIDYVAMDIKNSKEDYAKTIDDDIVHLSEVEKSVEILMSGSIDFEFRTTIVSEFHNEHNMLRIGQWIKGCEKYFLQKFVDSGELIENGLHCIEKPIAEGFLEVLRPYIPNVKLRGY